MKIPSATKQTIYVDFTRRTIYRRKSIFLRFANRFYLFEILLGIFTLVDIYFLANILITLYQR